MAEYERAARFVIRSHWRPFGKRWQFQLVAPNGEPVAVSEPYESEQAARDGIDAVRRYAPDALIALG